MNSYHPMNTMATIPTIMVTKTEEAQNVITMRKMAEVIPKMVKRKKKRKKKKLTRRNRLMMIS